MSFLYHLIKDVIDDIQGLAGIFFSFSKLNELSNFQIIVTFVFETTFHYDKQS